LRLELARSGITAAALTTATVISLRLVGRAKRLPVPAELQSLDLAPRHLSLLSILLFDGRMTVNDLAGRLEVAPTTLSLMVGELSRKRVPERREDEDDRRRIVSITDAQQPSIRAWLARGATAWQGALSPLTPAERHTVVATLLAYEKSAEEPAEPKPDPDSHPGSSRTPLTGNDH
jgi:DNA-binding MarR family transcriptional regulator